MINPIEVVGPVDGYVEEMLNRYGRDIANIAKGYKTTVTVAQKDKALYVNSGNITSRLDMSKMEKASDFLRVFFNNIRGNSEAANKGLQKGFEIIA